MFANAFPTTQPMNISCSDMAEVSFIDGLLSCRGGAAIHSRPGQFCTDIQQAPIEMSQPMLDIGNVLQQALHQYSLMRQQPSNIDIQMVRGRPMRCMQTNGWLQESPGSSPPGSLPSLGSGMMPQINGAPPAWTPPGQQLAIEELPQPAPPNQVAAPPNAAASPRSDARDDVAAVAAAMLARSMKKLGKEGEEDKKGAEAKADDDDDDESSSEPPKKQTRSLLLRRA